MSRPFFSIVVPTYNRAHLISKTIDSILLQQYPHFEIIIVDDGSTDNTANAVAPYLNEQVRYFVKNNEERAAARNFGTRQAKGDYINWFDSDDLMLPHHLETAAALIEQHQLPEVVALSFSIVTVDCKIVKTVIFPTPICNRVLYRQNILACNPVVVRKDIALQHPFNEDRQLSASEDYELWLRLAALYPFHTSTTISSHLIQHDERSVNVAAAPEAITSRFNSFLKHTLSDEAVRIFLGKKQSNFEARIYSLIATTLGVNGHKKQALPYFQKAIFTAPRIVFHRHFYVFIKVMLWPTKIKKAAA